MKNREKESIGSLKKALKVENLIIAEKII